jgi:hypothetical protein
MYRSTKTIVGLLIVIAGVFGYSLMTKKDTNRVASTFTPPTVEVPKKENTTQEKAVPPPIEVPVDSSTAFISSDSVILTLTAKDSVWISITPDNGVGGFRGKLKKGETRTFIANDKFLVFMGNQKALLMKLNGEGLTHLPTIENSSLVVRNVVLTRDKAYIKPEGEKIFDSKPSPGSITPTAKKTKNASSLKKQSPNIKKPIPNVQPVLPNAN